MSRDLSADPDYFPCRDPAITYEQKEARTCNGCVHITTARAFGALHQFCSCELDLRWIGSADFIYPMRGPFDA